VKIKEISSVCKSGPQTELGAEIDQIERLNTKRFISINRVKENYLVQTTNDHSNKGGAMLKHGRSFIAFFGLHRLMPFLGILLHMVYGLLLLRENSFRAFWHDRPPPRKEELRCLF
jgi:hypothetical protein